MANEIDPEAKTAAFPSDPAAAQPPSPATESAASPPASSPSSTPTNITLETPKRFCPYGGMVGSQTSQWDARTADLLHKRLRALGLLYVVVSVLSHTRNFVVGVGFSQTLPLIILATMAAATAYMYFDKTPPLIKCRFLEVYFFAAPVVVMVYIDRMLMVQSAADPGVMLMNWYRLILHMALLIAAYTLFIPAGWRRTLIVTGVMGTVPFITLGVMMSRLPEVAAAVQQAMTAEIFTGGAMLMMIFVAIAAFGTYTIDSARHQVAKAGFAGQYQLEKKIGSGGMGEVWLARHKLLARKAAIKVIRPEVLGGNGGRGSSSGGSGGPGGSGASGGSGGRDRTLATTAMKRFEREAQATATLTSAHTIDVYDFGIAHDGSFYYVMQYLDGLDLNTLVEQHGPVPVERAVHLLTQACASLADAHENGLIHRDIKPSNIFATRMGISHDFVKVLDFGLVKETNADMGATALTQQGMTSGTPAFMPPEIALAKQDVDGRADIYALGCVGYWLTTGQYVFPSESPMAMVVDHVKSEPEAPSTRTELPIPSRFDEVILQTLAKDPAVRFQSMREFAAALRQVPVPEPWDDARAEEWWRLHPAGDDSGGNGSGGNGAAGNGAAAAATAAATGTAAAGAAAVR